MMTITKCEGNFEQFYEYLKVMKILSYYIHEIDR